MRTVPNPFTSTRIRRYAGPVLLGCIATLIAVVLGLPAGNEQPDSEWYRLLAEGHPAKVIQPFASRPLEPLLVKSIDHTFGLSVITGFACISVISLACCIIGCAYLLSRFKANLGWLTAIVFLPVWTTLFHAYMLPDIFYSALVIVFCVCLLKNWYWAAAFMFIPLYAARECTALTLICFGIACFRLIDFRILVVSAISALAGLKLQHILAAGTLGNRHGIGEIAYLIGKLPYNISKNFLGIPFWSTTLPVCQPTRTYQLPHLPIFGSIGAIGPCKWDPQYIATTLLLYLSTFGILPVLLMVERRSKTQHLLRKNPLVRFCALYGFIAFVIGPALGASVHRLVAYGWPAFTFAVPLLWPNLFTRRHLLLAIHLLTCWFAWLVFWKMNALPWVLTAIVCSALSWCVALYSTRSDQPQLSSLSELLEPAI